MAVLRSVLYLIGSVGLGYALLKLISQDESTYLKKYPENQKGRGVAGVHHTAKAKEPLYQHTGKEMDAVKSEL